MNNDENIWNFKDINEAFSKYAEEEQGLWRYMF